MPNAIDVSHVYKKYSRNVNTHLSYAWHDFFAELLNRKPSRELRPDEFWAVEDISLTLEAGRSLGLIGRNGSGKTTLLKMLHGLIKLDSGVIALRGHVQALINLNAGFNADLSGRENIYNAASLQGLSARQATAILDEVIAFSELEPFIDSPLHTYSSGMKARLGFAAAVHLQPDILLVDEILSVGDFAFQNKCFVKMQTLKKNGTSIILVSHSHTQILQICDESLWLHHGKGMQHGPSRNVMAAYLGFLEQEQAAHLEDQAPQPSAHEASALFGPVHTNPGLLDNVDVHLYVGGQQTSVIPIHAQLTIRYNFNLRVAVKELNITLNFYRNDGFLISALSTLKGDSLKSAAPGAISCEVRIEDLNFAPGEYVVVMPVHEGHSYLFRDVVAEFIVTGQGEIFWGVVDLRHEYEVRHDGA